MLVHKNGQPLVRYAAGLADRVTGGGGMAGTADDMLKLLEARADDGGPVLSKATVDAGFSNQIGDLEMK